MDKSIEELLKESNDNYTNWYNGIINMKLKGDNNGTK